MLIIIGHGQDFYSAVLPEILVHMSGYGGIGVAMFAFLSGIGLWYSQNKDSSVKHFYLKRIKRVLLPYLIISVPFYILYDWILKGNFVKCLLDIFCISFFLNGGGTWYVAWALLVYILYPWFHKADEYLKKKLNGKRIIHFVALIILLIAEITLCFSGKEYILLRYQNALGATIAFVIGDYLAPYIRKNSKWVVILTCAFVFIAPLYLLNIVEGVAFYVWFFALCGIALCGFSAICLSVVPDALKKLLSVIGACSLESYIFNVSLIALVRIALNDLINTLWGFVAYIAIATCGLILSVFTANLLKKVIHR